MWSAIKELFRFLKSTPETVNGCSLLNVSRRFAMYTGLHMPLYCTLYKLKISTLDFWKLTKPKFKVGYVKAGFEVEARKYFD